ncbi:hypothetical protein MesoLj113a_42980 [Mesorhizobium sp. 113-1-2]|nr:hypothetical protein MLTONO_0712 [Mesorhizobium loti]BCG73140.1 hypothetical protein MesoLj113a_42980 [Mesorhizobium sp. 113-1-2]
MRQQEPILEIGIDYFVAYRQRLLYKQRQHLLLEGAVAHRLPGKVCQIDRSGLSGSRYVAPGH